MLRRSIKLPIAHPGRFLPKLARLIRRVIFWSAVTRAFML
jgi:hypothetical protein